MATEPDLGMAFPERFQDIPRPVRGLIIHDDKFTLDPVGKRHAQHGIHDVFHRVLLVENRHQDAQFHKHFPLSLLGFQQQIDSFRHHIAGLGEPLHNHVPLGVHIRHPIAFSHVKILVVVARHLVRVWIKP